MDQSFNGRMSVDLKDFRLYKIYILESSYSLSVPLYVLFT